MKHFKGLFWLVFGFLACWCWISEGTNTMTVQKGSNVSFDYTLTVEGEVVDSSKERSPLQYTHGEGQIITGLAKELEGMSIGEQRVVEVIPKEAYGEVNPNAFKEFSNSMLPKGITPQVGMYLQMQTKSGQPMPVRIAEVKDKTIVVDFNHPLAGKTLSFNVTIVAIE